jgi:putative nucleotidyltransferase with HDIG domain
MRRYLALAIGTTVLVIVLPAALISAIVPRGGLLLMAVSSLAVMALSIAIATAGAALWKRHPRSRDVVFSELLLWGWLRRCWTERRLSQARELFDCARKAGPAVSIELVTGLSRLLEARDTYTHGHSQRVARYAGQIARAMHLSPVEIAEIRTAAAVHDVGKLYTPREILNNPNRLSDAEYEVAKRHALWGARMLSAVGDEKITAMVRHHHERMDGHGYPDGLAGSEIPIGARIIAVADTFDAMTSSRPYRAACPHKKALDVLAEEAGSQLDAAAVAAFLGCYSSRRSVAWWALAASVPQRILEGLRAVPPAVGINSGAATILPAIGAAGLFAFSHSAPLRTPVTPLKATPTALAQPVKQPAKLTTTPAPAMGTSAQGSTRIGTARRTSRHSSRGPAPQPGSSTVPAPGASATRPGTSAGSSPHPSGPVAATPTAPPASTSPLPTPSAPAPPVSIPALPVPPAPPVTPPIVSTPTVTIPAVTIPSVTVPSVRTPKIEVPASSL